MSEIRDRPIKEIVESMMLLITKEKVKGQFARDLEKLCAIAFKHQEEDGIQDNQTRR